MYRYYQKNFIPLIFALLTISFLVCYFVSSIYWCANRALNEAYIMQVNWFLQNQNEQGEFPYQLEADGTIGTESAIVVRQLLGLHSLAEAYRKDHNPEVKKRVEQGISFYTSHLVQQQVLLDNQPVTTQYLSYLNQDYNNATAFLLLTLIEFSDMGSNTYPQSKQLITELGNYLLITQLPSGGFSYTPTDQTENVFNNGETFYALASLARYSDDQKYFEAAKKSATYFMQKYQNFDKNFYAWGMYGFYNLYQVSPKEEYWKFMQEQTNSYFKQKGNAAQNYFEHQIIPAPSIDTIVFTEGVLQTAKLAHERKEVDYYNQLKKFSESSLFYISHYQINGKHSEFKSDYSQLTGAICLDTQCKATRVDSTAHTLSAYVSYFSLNLKD